MAAAIYTLAALKTAVYARLENNTLFFRPFAITAIINEAIKCTNILTGFYQGTLPVVSAAGKLIYSVPAGMLYPQRIQFEGIQLDPVPITQIGQDYRTWASDTTANKGQVARWIPIGINYFALHPADALGGLDIEVTGVLEPPLLVADGDSMVLDDEYVTIIVEYAASRAPLKCGGKVFADASKLYVSGFQKSVKPLLAQQQFKFPKYFIVPGAPVPEGKQ